MDTKDLKQVQPQAAKNDAREQMEDEGIELSDEILDKIAGGDDIIEYALMAPLSLEGMNELAKNVQ